MAKGKFRGTRCKKPPGGKRAGAGRPPKPKDPTLFQQIYDQIDRRIPQAFQVIDLALKPCLKQGKKEPRPTEEKLKIGVKVALDLIDKRLPKQFDGELTIPITLVVKNPIPGVKPR